mmetsp:Transcript_511/g.1430  ORF Transcript_511/g.1430 Transcript_511/m.1430 type:complete len:239 (+) Transcript_511:1713-2429(+)
MAKALPRHHLLALAHVLVQHRRVHGVQQPRVGVVLKAHAVDPAALAILAVLATAAGRVAGAVRAHALLDDDHASGELGVGVQARQHHDAVHGREHGRADRRCEVDARVEVIGVAHVARPEGQLLREVGRRRAAHWPDEARTHVAARSTQLSELDRAVLPRARPHCARGGKEGCDDNRSRQEPHAASRGASRSSCRALSAAPSNSPPPLFCQRREEAPAAAGESGARPQQPSLRHHSTT